MQSFQNHLVHR